jgi:hypothetical protein
LRFPPSETHSHQGFANGVGSAPKIYSHRKIAFARRSPLLLPGRIAMLIKKSRYALLRLEIEVPHDI